MFGTRRFDEFAAHLSIARNVLAARLNTLIDAGILVQVPVLVALLQWGDRWLQTSNSIPIHLIERKSGRVLEPMWPRDQAGKALTLRDLDWAPGPGSTDPRIAPLVSAYEKQRRVEPRPIHSPKKRRKKNRHES